ncbi:MAG: type II toxin-antitoxin system prevent-host-death family antitoxin [Caldisericia bacterium]|jgi:prevent-host-death family protein|nr:type II toxin-antitoxin system prevent-host-death family antitoxin [Caldisericia bacterium]
MLEFILATNLKKDLLEILDEVEKGRSYLIVKKGKPSAVLLNVEYYESLIETVKLLKDKEFLKEYLKIEED